MVVPDRCLPHVRDRARGGERELRPSPDRRAGGRQRADLLLEAPKRCRYRPLTKSHASPYRLRKQLPEPVFGQTKQARGFRQFLLRGFEKVRAEWALICTAHNLLKLAYRWNLSAALPRATGAT